jgi:hypothetical protein
MVGFLGFKLPLLRDFTQKQKFFKLIFGEVAINQRVAGNPNYHFVTKAEVAE